MKRVVLTGATSFLGKRLLIRLLESGYYVYAVVRNENRLKELKENKNLSIITADLEHIEVLKEKIKQADYFFHFAWDGSGKEGRAKEAVQNKNIGYSLRALKVAADLNCEMFIFSGSQAEYGCQSGEIKETNYCAPISPYGKCKLDFSVKAALFCKENNIRLIHLRIFSVYGPGDREDTLITHCIKEFSQNKLLQLGPCLQQWNYLYIDDFVTIVLKMIAADLETGIYNIASNDTRILRQFVEEVFILMERKGKFQFGEQIFIPEKFPDLNPNIEKLEKCIGKIAFTSFAQGILETRNALCKGGQP